MGKSLVIVEVSQKQAYIFSSNNLKDNIENSAAIAYVTSCDYFQSCSVDFCQDKNEVYCGGGHAVLEFDDYESAKRFVQKVSWDAKQHFPDMELFATIYEQKEEESPADTINKLIQQLEIKKAFRRASFAQGTFGVEDVDSRSRETNLLSINGVPYSKNAKVPSNDKDDKDFYPAGYARAFKFEDLSGSKGDNNFIAVVHVDGNAMGKRVEEIRNSHGQEAWEDYRKAMKDFSEGIASDFKNTFKEMCTVVAGNVKEEKSGDITSQKLGDITLKTASDGKPYLPVRRIITEGDDICFVTEGRIGIECARIFMEILSKKENKEDEKPYAACAGVAIVHQKYPFYRAYELAEDLCSHAKKYVANSTKDVEGADASNVCAIDWHIEFGEVGEGIEEIRKSYITADGKRMELRPYVVSGLEKYLELEAARDYQNFRKVLTSLNGTDAFARGKIKGLRDYIRKGETASENYLAANSIKDITLNCYSGIYADIDLDRIGSGKGQERSLLIKTTDGESRFIAYDAIEIMDTFLPLDDGCRGISK